MKVTDFRREHFENGMNYSEEDFQAYINANLKVTRSVYTQYVPCLLGGVLVSQIFAAGIGGFEGNMLALVIIFGGLIAGAVLSKKSGEDLRYYAGKLGITRKDVVAAKAHVKNKTVAWSQPEQACESR